MTLSEQKEKNILKQKKYKWEKNMEKCKCKEGCLKFKKLHPEALIPQYQTKDAAAFDFHALIVDEKDVMGKLTDEIYISPGETKLIRTGLACDPGPEYKLDITPRSGMARWDSITIVNTPGKIDSGYRGEIGIILHNLGDKPKKITHKDRIAQCEWRPVHRATIMEVDELDKTERNTGGFGSTGT
jgi:dUTP pyrophosphatase